MPEETLIFAAEGKVKATIETQPLESINDVFSQLKTGKVNGRIVLGIGERYRVVVEGALHDRLEPSPRLCHVCGKLCPSFTSFPALPRTNSAHSSRRQRRWAGLLQRALPCVTAETRAGVWTELRRFSSQSMLSLAGGEAVRKVSIALLLTCFLLTAVVQAQKESSPSVPEVKIGDLAPDFTLVDQKGRPRSLHDYTGKKNVALAFYVWAFSAD